MIISNFFFGPSKCLSFCLLCSLFLSGLYKGCGRQNKPISSGSTAKNTSDLEAAAALAKNTVSITNLKSIETEGAPLTKNLGPRILLLNSAALAQSAGRCFGKTPRKNDANQTYFNSYPERSFLPAEERALGKMDVFNSIGIKSAGNPIISLKHFTSMKKKPDVNQEYLHALRSFLGTACNNLVTEEFGLLASQPLKNKLVRSDKPTGADVSGFMNCLYDFVPNAGLHEGADEYAALFNANLATSEAAKDKAGYLKKNYFQLCVAVGSDPRFFSR